MFSTFSANNVFHFFSPMKCSTFLAYKMCSTCFLICQWFVQSFSTMTCSTFSANDVFNFFVNCVSTYSASDILNLFHQLRLLHFSPMMCSTFFVNDVFCFFFAYDMFSLFFNYVFIFRTNDVFNLFRHWRVPFFVHLWRWVQPNSPKFSTKVNRRHVFSLNCSGCDSNVYYWTLLYQQN